MRGKSDRNTNARLRSAIVSAGGINASTKSSCQDRIKIYRENAQGVKYESLTIANKSPILNPSNHRSRHKFGFAQMTSH